MISEAKKKKGKKKEKEQASGPKYSTAPDFDFSLPLGDSNLYKSQGAANFGPYTALVKDCPPMEIEEGLLGPTTKLELRESSAWDPFKRIVEQKNNGTWEQAARLVRGMK